MAMPREVPKPKDWEELEQYVARFARAYLCDFHARRYAQQGTDQHGIDVLARDRRPGGTEQLWAFEAKCYTKKELKPQLLERTLEKLEGFPYREELSTFILVTTADVSKAVQHKELELRKRLKRRRHKLDFEVWGWEEFSQKLVEYCGAGPWLSRSERELLRKQYCDAERRQFQQAGPLYPLLSSATRDQEVRLEEVLVPQTLRAWQPPGPQGEQQPVGPDKPLVAWLAPQRETDKPLVLVLALMGMGKTVALLHAAATLASTASTDSQAPLPLRIKASELSQVNVDEHLQRRASRNLRRLWEDPMSTWVVLVDGLDEVEEGAQQDVLNRILELHGDGRVVAVAAACRTSHLHSRLLPEAVRIELLPWRDKDHGEFLRRWSRAQSQSPRPGAPSSAKVAPSLRVNPLCSTLFALLATSPGEEWMGTARLFRRFLDELFNEWARENKRGGWHRLAGAFERMMLAGLGHGGPAVPRSVLEAALAQALSESEAVPALKLAERRFGLIRLVEGRVEFPLRAVAEYLAAGALLERSDAGFLEAASQLWAAEVASMALVRAWDQERKRALALMRRLLRARPGDAPDQAVRKVLVAAQAARELGPEAAPIARAIARRLRDFVTEETSAWRRQHAAAEVRRIAQEGGPLWEALWRELKPAVLATGDRAAWLARHGPRTRAHWVQRLQEQDLSVRVTATRQLKAWKSQWEVQNLLLWQILDQGRGIEPHEQPALAAAAVLRTVPRTQRLLKPLKDILHAGDQRSAGAAAVALLPGEADAETLLLAIQQLFRAGMPDLVLLEAIKAHRRRKQSRAWMKRHWPDALTMKPWPLIRYSSPTAGQSSFPPPSQLVRNTLYWSITPALRGREVFEALRALPTEQLGQFGFIRAVCVVADTAPEAALELLERRPKVIPIDAQLSLGRAALVHPRVGQALVNLWRTRTPKEAPSSFPGIALDLLAARGEPEAVQVYAEWLPEFIGAFVPAQWLPSREALRQPAVRGAARTAARNAWVYAVQGRIQPDGTHGTLGLAPLGGVLQGLWPAWEDEPQVREGLVAWARSGTLEQFNVALRSWLDGQFPEEVSRYLAQRLSHRERWPSDPAFLRWGLALWLRAVERAGVLPEIEPVLTRLVRDLEPSTAFYLACAHLVRLEPAHAAEWTKLAAAAWPVDWDDHDGVTPSEVEVLLGAAPEAWAQRSLEALQQYDTASVALLFLRMARRLWSLLPTNSPSREALVQATRTLAESPGPWLAPDMLGMQSIQLSDAAQELLFQMGAPLVAGGPAA